MLKSLLLLFFLSICVFSCIPHKKIIYIQSPEEKPLNIVERNEPVYRVQPGDVLSIKVHSLEPSISEFFNIAPANMNVTTQAPLYLNGYSITDSGFVTVPLLGKIQVSNLTVIEVQNKIQKAIDLHLKNATVVIKLTSFKVSVLGDVQRPGYFNVYNDKMNILESISLAGDLTTTGNRKNIKLIRHEEHQIKTYIVDITKPHLLTSDIYYLHPNDVVYVEQMKARSLRTNVASLSVIFTGITTLLVLINFFINVNSPNK